VTIFTEVMDGTAFTILVVDDDCSIRRLIEAIFSSSSFSGLYASSGDEALQISANHPGPIHLLLSDVIMPGMDGVTLCDRIAKERPETALLLMSGHALAIDPGPRPLLEKPFTPEVLLLRIRQLLKTPGRVADRGARAASAPGDVGSRPLANG
jgi:two-component system, cell cycle sensor histidine kinase and response regulator CckA